MVDRLISGAGALSARVDGVVRSVLPGSAMSGQPASLLIAALLVVVALVLVVVGLESSGSSTLRQLEPAAVASTDELGNRVFATIDGRVPSTYVETFPDDDFDGVQDPGETGQAWDYFLLGPDGDEGVMVRSERPPSSIYRFISSGVVVDDADYVTTDLEYLGSDYSIPDLVIDPDTYIDATSSAGGEAIDLSRDLPAAGTNVSLDAARIIEYVTVCSTDPNGDGTCSSDEVDLYDVVVYDPVSHRAVVVVTPASPEFQDVSFTGILHKDARSVADSLATPGVSLADMGFTISPTYLLEDGAQPAETTPMFVLALIAGLTAAVLVAGVLGGYIVFRRGGSLPVGATTMAPGDRLAARVSGHLRAPDGLVHVREAPADLVRYVLVPTPESAAADVGEVPTVDPIPALEAAPAREAATTLIVERRDRPEGVAVGLGELTTLSAGTVITLGAARPGLRVTAGTGPIILSFDDEATRDRAAAELVDETGLGTPIVPVTEEDA